VQLSFRPWVVASWYAQSSQRLLGLRGQIFAASTTMIPDGQVVLCQGDEGIENRNSSAAGNITATLPTHSAIYELGDALDALLAVLLVPVDFAIGRGTFDARRALR
jgi:hypothetical protein